MSGAVAARAVAEYGFSALPPPKIPKRTARPQLPDNTWIRGASLSEKPSSQGRDKTWSQQILASHRENAKLASPQERNKAWRRQVLSVYREYLREAHTLGHPYLKHFFHIKAADDFRALMATQEHGGKRPNLRERKLGRILREVNKIHRAVHEHDVAAYTHLLDLAYGRKGKLHRELLQPYLTDPSQLPSERIIGPVPKSRPPVYSPILTALLLSPAGRNGKALNKNTYNIPDNLPDTTSAQAEILKRGWKRRTVNAHWRHFTHEVRKTAYPLDSDILQGPTLPKLGVLDDLAQLVDAPASRIPLTRREREAKGETVVKHVAALPVSRFVRRRFMNLMDRIPIVTAKPDSTGYTVSAAGKGKDIPEVDEATMAWVDKWNSEAPQPKKTRRAARQEAAEEGQRLAETGPDD